jgi:diguanylate cyclase (GGDEF)-like protein
VIIAALLWAGDKVFGQNQELERLTVTDVLTDLPNRRGLLQQTDQALAQHRRNGRPLSLALLDLDHFKRVNDYEGHPMGDAVLRHIATRIADSTRTSDLLARLGGEEFGLLMPETGQDGARELCERIRVAIEEADLPMTGEISDLTISIGLTTVTVDSDTEFDHLYVEADRALYEAKRAGRNRTVVYA